MDPLLLAVDTTSRRGGVCLARPESVVAELNLDVGLSFSENLLEMIDFIMRISHCSLQELSALAVTTGPGSFTGLRVGIATMKALAFRLQKGLFGVTALEALAEAAGMAGTVAPFMDARRGQVYAALFSKQELKSTPILLREGEVASPGDWIASVQQRGVLFAGDGVRLYRGLIEAAGHVVSSDPLFLARAAARLALRRMMEGVSSDPGAVDAYYIRPSDARLPGEAAG